MQTVRRQSANAPSKEKKQEGKKEQVKKAEGSAPAEKVKSHTGSRRSVKSERSMPTQTQQSVGTPNRQRRRDSRIVHRNLRRQLIAESKNLPLPHTWQDATAVERAYWHEVSMQLAMLNLNERLRQPQYRPARVQYRERVAKCVPCRVKREDQVETRRRREIDAYMRDLEKERQGGSYVSLSLKRRPQKIARRSLETGSQQLQEPKESPQQPARSKEQRQDKGNKPSPQRQDRDKQRQDKDKQRPGRSAEHPRTDFTAQSTDDEEKKDGPPPAPPAVANKQGQTSEWVP